MTAARALPLALALLALASPARAMFQPTPLERGSLASAQACIASQAGQPVELRFTIEELGGPRRIVTHALPGNGRHCVQQGMLERVTLEAILGGRVACALRDTSARGPSLTVLLENGAIACRS